MPINRSTYQSNKSLYEFYTNFAKHENEVFAKGAIQMIEFIELVNKIFPKTQLWAHTSHARLGIQPVNDKLLTTAVYVSNIGVDEFYFEFKLPLSKQPWENAWVKGQVNTLDEAIKYLLISMHESNQWNDNSELKELIDHLEK